MTLSTAARWARRWGPPVGLAVLILTVGLTTLVLRRYSNLTRWTTHTYEVIAQIGRVETRIERIETAARGSLLTRESQFDHIYAENRAELPIAIDRLRQLISDNPTQTERVNALAKAYAAHATKLDDLVRESLLKPNLKIRGRLQTLVELRQRIQEVGDEEARLLRVRQLDAESFARAAAALMLIAILVAGVMLTLAQVSGARAARSNEAQAGLLRSIFESIGDGLIVTDLNGHFTHHNRNAQKILGVSFDEVKTIAELGFITDMPPERSPTRRALRGESVSDVEFKLGGAGAERVISADGRPVVGHDGRRVGALAIVRDVTERRLLEDEWKLARESALEASRLKSDFLATMSHEIRTPMNGVIGMSTILLETPLTDDQRSYVNTIKGSADALLALINQVLDHAKIESGKLELTSVDFNVLDLIDSVTDLFRYLARSKALDLRVELSPDVPAALRGDADRLRQVLVNLVGNALKFTDQGYVEITLRWAEVGGGLPGRVPIEFVVRDTGRGMSPAAQERLFQKFSQVGDARASRGGSGLGLMISRELVRAMGGDVWVRSAEGLGSRFGFTVALEPALTCPLKPARTLAFARALRGRVLVAEDQPVNQLVIGKFLEHIGVSFEIVGDGEACLAALENNSFDLVLMDCQMRPMDGYQATARIRAREAAVKASHPAGQREHRLPVVALTAEGMSGDRRRCFEVGMDDFLSKPIVMEHLYAMLKKRLPDVTEPVPVGPEFRPEMISKLDGFESDGEPLALVLFEEFRTGGAADVEKLSVAVESKAWGDVRHLAHSLKSSGRTLGLAWFGDLCETLEHEGGGSRTLDADVLRLRDLHSSGCAWLDQILRPTKASNG